MDFLTKIKDNAFTIILGVSMIGIAGGTIFKEFVIVWGCAFILIAATTAFFIYALSKTDIG